MVDDSYFHKLFNIDQKKYTANYLKSLPSKSNYSFSDSFHQYCNQFVIEYVNGKVITDSLVTSCGFAQRLINKELVQHIANPCSINSPSLNISGATLNNKKRISIIKNAESEVFNKSIEIEGLAIKWTSYQKYTSIVNSEDFNSSKIETLSSISISVTINKKGKLFVGKSLLSVEVEKEEITTQIIIQLIDNALNDAENHSNSKQIVAADYDIIFSNKCSGILIHEIVGHLVEADYIYNKQSILQSQLNSKISSSQLSISDCANIEGPLKYPFDDEGVKSQSTILVEKGVLKNWIVDKYHAINMNLESSGNSRRSSYSYLPLPRMSNTKIHPGTYEQNEMIESTKKGILIEDVGNGHINTKSGDFVFTDASGFFIENGIIKYPLFHLSLSANAKTTLKSIKMIAKDYNISNFHADCEKENQVIPVGFAQPSIKISEINIS